LFSTINNGVKTMTNVDVKVIGDKVANVLSESGVMRQLVEDVLNQVLDAQMDDHLGAKRYEHDPDRAGYRNGYRIRAIQTRVGTLNLRVPQTRDGSFCTEIFNRYQRSEKALTLTLMDMYLNGVSTRKVTKITEKLCGTSFSKSTVSKLNAELDVRVNAWKNRPLEHEYPFLIVDAMVVDVRRDGQIRSTGALIVYGINDLGEREPLDLMMADSESEASWDAIFKRLKSRGIKGIDLVVSDAHSGLVLALKRNFQGASWQRCHTHFMRNILGHTPRKCRQKVREDLKLLLLAENPEVARKLANEMLGKFEKEAPNAMDNLEAGLESVLTILNYPEPYRRRLRTTNLAERMNEEIRRRL
jgi:putative transposase